MGFHANATWTSRSARGLVGPYRHVDRKPYTNQSLTVRTSGDRRSKTSSIGPSHFLTRQGRAAVGVYPRSGCFTGAMPPLLPVSIPGPWRGPLFAEKRSIPAHFTMRNVLFLMRPNEWKGLPRPKQSATRRTAKQCQDGKCNRSSTHSEGKDP